MLENDLEPYMVHPGEHHLPSTSIERFTINSLIDKLNDFFKILNSHGIDPEVVN